MNFDDLRTVNAAVNVMPYVADATRYGFNEFWAEIDRDGGDCEDYAIAKLRRLLAMGWPVSALRLACCYTETGEYHAVLLADLDGQTWVLDNRQPHPIEHHLLRYTWDKFQIAGTQRWERV